MSQKKLIIANWKQTKTLGDTLVWCKEFVRLWGVHAGKVLPIICPPTPFLEKILQVLTPTGVELGVQDISPFDDGAHTGSVGVNQVRQFIKYAIVGHSERVEDRELVWQKAQRCLAAGITPIVCFKSSDQYKIIEGAVYALEDPQNISQNGVYLAKNIAEVKKLIDDAREFFGSESIIIYGGSVNGENAQELASISKLDGVLVGNASLNPVTFCDIVSKFSL